MALRVKPIPYTYDENLDLDDVIRQYNYLTPNHSAINKLKEEFKTNNPNFKHGDVVQIPVLTSAVRFHETKKFQLRNVAPAKTTGSVEEAPQPVKPAVVPPKPAKKPISPELKQKIEQAVEIKKEPYVEITGGNKFKRNPPDGPETSEPLELDQEKRRKKKDDIQAVKEILQKESVQPAPQNQPKSMIEADRAVEEPEVKKGTNKYKSFPYTFSRPNETVRAVIRLYNDMTVTPKVIEWLMEEFNKLNKDNLPPKLGSTVQIPVLLPFTWRHEKERSVFTDGK